MGHFFRGVTWQSFSFIDRKRLLSAKSASAGKCNFSYLAIINKHQKNKANNYATLVTNIALKLRTSVGTKNVSYKVNKKIVRDYFEPVHW